jgi:hypothetical protein
MDGYEVCERLKANDATKNIPVIFVTAKSEVDDEIRGFNLGAVDYVTKPFSPPIIKARVKTHLTLHNHSMLLNELVNKQTDALNVRIEELQILSELQDLEKASHSIEEAEEKILTYFNCLFDTKKSGLIFPDGFKSSVNLKNKLPEFTTEEMNSLPKIPLSEMTVEELSHGCMLPIVSHGENIAKLWYVVGDLRKYEISKLNRFAHVCGAVLKSALLRKEIEQGFNQFDNLSLD